MLIMAPSFVNSEIRCTFRLLLRVYVSDMHVGFHAAQLLPRSSCKLECE